MAGRPLALAALTLASLMLAGLALRAASPATEAAFAKFWRAATVADAEKLVAEVAKSGVTFDDAVTLLKNGRPYDPKAAKGIVKLSHKVGADDFAYTVDVPDTYDASKRYQLRVQLHGGVGRPDAAPRGNGIGALAGAEQIYLLPTAWNAAEWWTDRQLDNLRFVVDAVKSAYNIAENSVALSGVSGGVH